MRIAVIIVAYAGDSQLMRVLDSVFGQDIPREEMEVCVVANRPLAAAQQKYESRVEHWINPGSNLGASGGRNVGVKTTTAETLCFLDDDGVADPRFVSAMTELLSERPDAAVIRGRIQALHYPMVSRVHVSYDLGDKVRECLCEIEGATVIPRRFYEAVGGYDTKVFHHEGMEFFARLLDKFDDAVCLYNPNAILYHDFAEGFWGLWKKGKRAVVTEFAADGVSPKAREYKVRVMAKHPLKRPPLPVRLYKAPAEIVYRLSKRYHRMLAGRAAIEH